MILWLEVDFWLWVRNTLLRPAELEAWGVGLSSLAGWCCSLILRRSLLDGIVLGFSERERLRRAILMESRCGWLDVARGSDEALVWLDGLAAAVVV